MSIHYTTYALRLIYCCLFLVQLHTINAWNNDQHNKTIVCDGHSNIKEMVQQRHNILTNINAAEEAAQALKEALQQAHHNNQLSDDDLSLACQWEREACNTAQRARYTLQRGISDEVMSHVSSLNSVVSQMERMYNGIQPAISNEQSA